MTISLSDPLFARYVFSCVNLKYFLNFSEFQSLPLYSRQVLCDCGFLEDFLSLLLHLYMNFFYDVLAFHCVVNFFGGVLLIQGIPRDLLFISREFFIFCFMVSFDFFVLSQIFSLQFLGCRPWGCFSGTPVPVLRDVSTSQSLLMELQQLPASPSLSQHCRSSSQNLLGQQDSSLPAALSLCFYFL